MTTKVCEQCDKEMKLVPAGFSKTKNKPYSAFWSCDKRNGGCGATANASEEEGGGRPAGQASEGNSASLVAKIDAIDRKLDALLIHFNLE